MNGISKRQKQKSVLPGDAVLTGNILTIQCRGCEHLPDACSQNCINCICDAIVREGTAERIRLLSGKDIDISGPSAEIFCDLAKVNRPITTIPTGRKCMKCPRSPAKVLENVWAEFPDPSFTSACARLYTDSRDGPECYACLQKTYSALMAADGEMNSIREKTSSLAGGKGGVF